MAGDDAGVHIGRQIVKIARDVMRASDLLAPRVADIGCYKRPLFSFVQGNFPQAQFLGVDVDEEALAWLGDNGIDAITYEDFLRRPPGSFDFCFLLEVIEHIRSEESQSFLQNVLDRTAIAAFLTTPNFEGWAGPSRDTLSLWPGYAEMRYKPDHLEYFRPTSNVPHTHKRAMTLEWLVEDIASVLPEGWAFKVYKAWPWTLIDHSTGARFKHCFKLYAIIWNTGMIEAETVTQLEADWLAPFP